MRGDYARIARQGRPFKSRSVGPQGSVRFFIFDKRQGNPCRSAHNRNLSVLRMGMGNVEVILLNGTIIFIFINVTRL